MSDYDNETNLLCSEFSQQDWSSLQFKESYQHGFRDAREYDKEIIQSLETELERVKKQIDIEIKMSRELRREVDQLKQVITAQSTRGA